MDKLYESAAGAHWGDVAAMISVGPFCGPEAAKYGPLC